MVCCRFRIVTIDKMEAKYPPLDDALMWLKRVGIDLKLPKFNIIAKFLIFNVYLAFTLELTELCRNYNDIEVIAGICEIFLSVLLVAAKLYMLLLHRKRINLIIRNVYNFWPIDKFDGELEEDLNKTVKTLQFLLSFYRWFAVITTSMFIRLPNIWKGTKRLPMALYEPIDLHYSPIFQIFFVYEIFVTFFTSFVNIAVDSLFASLASSLIIQFRLLGRALKNLKAGHNAVEEKENFDNMITYIKYHNHLIGVVKELQDTHTLLFLSMFVSSSVYICIDLYLGANDRMFDDLRNLITYICQGSFFTFLLFVYCFAGNRLTHECSIIGDNIYESDWWSSYSSRNRNGILLVIQRAQKLERLTAGGLMQLDIDNFVRMLRLSFSFFTLIRKSKNKNL